MRYQYIFVLIFLLLFGSLASAVGHQESDDLRATSSADSVGDRSVPTRIASLRGPTGVGIAPAIVRQPINGTDATITVEVVPDPSVMIARLAAGEADIGMLPTNVAAQLYNRGVPIKIAAVTLWGLLYVVSDDESIDDWDDLIGKQVYSIARGGGPDILLRHLLTQKGVDPDQDLLLDYSYGHVELAQLVIAGEVSTALLPEPFVTQVLSRREDVSVRLDLQTTWSEFYGERYPQTVVVVRSEFAEMHPDATAKGLRTIREGWQTVLADEQKAGDLVEETPIGLPGAVVSQALPRFNAEYRDAKDVEGEIYSYLEVLFGYEPRSIGGALPPREIIYRR